MRIFLFPCLLGSAKLLATMDPQDATHYQVQVEEFRRRHRTSLVTLVFTDIVESTQLKHALGDHAGTVLVQQHRALLRELLGQFPEINVLVFKIITDVGGWGSCVRFTDAAGNPVPGLSVVDSPP